MLEAKRVGEVAILMCSLRASVKETIDALLLLDEIFLDEERIVKLLALSPSEAESKLLREHANSADKLSEQEQFLAKLAEVPNLQPKLMCLLFKIRFSESFYNFTRTLSEVKAALALLGKPEFKLILGVVL